MLIFEIPGEPIPKQRHRTCRRNGKSFSYDPQSNDKETVKLLLKSKVTEIFETGTENEIIEAENLSHADGIVVSMMFFLPVAESASHKKKADLLWNSYHQTKPDVDNLAKFYLDCANGILWSDDKKIFSLNVQKKYSSVPRTVMCVRGMRKKLIDEETWDIIESFSPCRLDDLVADLNRLSGLLEDIHCDGKTDLQVRAKDAARLVSRLADRFGKELYQVAKKYPNYWKRPC